MSTEAVRLAERWSPFEQLRCAQQILRNESRTLADLAGRLDGEFCRAVDLVFRCQGSVIVSGMGKAGLIGQKIMATLASTGTRSHCLHPAEAVHGDLGRVSRDDLMLILSQSGETEEVLRMLPSLVQLGVPMVAITGRAQARWAAWPTWSWSWGRWKRPTPWAWPPAAAPRPCWPWATLWPW